MLNTVLGNIIRVILFFLVNISATQGESFTGVVVDSNNGDTVMVICYCAWNRPQAIQVAPDKKIVWYLPVRGKLGGGFHAHFLDHRGYPEILRETKLGAE